MNKVTAFFKNNWGIILTVLLLVVVVYLIYYSGKKAGSGNTTVVDDQGNIVSPSTAQIAEANDIATRIYNDLNSGLLGGYNFFSSLGRDIEAYTAFANMSDSMFAFTAQTYRTKYNSSIIADITAESSLGTGGINNTQSPKDLILAKAQRLNIV